MPHDKLIKPLNFMIYFTFKSRTQNRISINKYSISNFVFNINFFKKAVDCLIRSCYFAIGDQVLDQIICNNQVSGFYKICININWKNYKQGALINYMKTVVLHLFNSHK